MPDGREPVTAKLLDRIADIPAAAWDACSGPDNPFLGHAFLQTLEDSGSVSADTGWHPQHLVIEDGEGGLAGAVPMYLKGHSFGEYVFDHGWADAYERAGGRYYPKLLVAVPFTPVPGPRLLVAAGAPETTEASLVAGLIEAARRHEVSSLHITYPSESQWRRLGEAGFLLRTGFQFHWENRDYKTFDDFLAALASRKRKAIRKERQEANAHGLTIHCLTGDDIKPAHWDAFYDFYQDTTGRKWGHSYLTREFFDLLGARLADRVLLIIAEDDGAYVAGALNLIGTDTLYGRNWGCLGDYRFLHFECCYYRAIDFAIANGFRWVEAGAQGPHKLQRGYLPKRTYSAHWIATEGFSDAVANYLDSERKSTDHEIAMLTEQSPFKKSET